MKIPFKINDDIIISNNDKDNDVSTPGYTAALKFDNKAILLTSTRE